MMLFGLTNQLLLCLCDLQSLNVFCLVAPIVSCCLLLSAVVYVAAVVCGAVCCNLRCAVVLQCDGGLNRCSVGQHVRRSLNRGGLQVHLLAADAVIAAVWSDFLSLVVIAVAVGF